MSASSKPTLAPSAYKASARFAAVVHLPTPPLPEATARMFLTFGIGVRSFCTLCAKIRQDTPTVASACRPAASLRARVARARRARFWPDSRVRCRLRRCRRPAHALDHAGCDEILAIVRVEILARRRGRAPCGLGHVGETRMKRTRIVAERTAACDVPRAGACVQCSFGNAVMPADCGASARHEVKAQFARQPCAR